MLCFKADNRGVISGTCPLCSAKGQINALRSYAFNFEESVTLCTSPLVSHIINFVLNLHLCIFITVGIIANKLFEKLILKFIYNQSVYIDFSKN